MIHADIMFKREQKGQEVTQIFFLLFKQLLSASDNVLVLLKKIKNKKKERVSSQVQSSKHKENGYDKNLFFPPNIANATESDLCTLPRNQR